MVAIYIYVDELIDDVLTPISKRIELFADESINIVSSIQNFNDLGKIFTDYSKSFTVPASSVNNKIFSYWYENSVNNSFDHRKKYFGRIEIDNMIFRFGKFQLEKADKKNNMIESYTINFTGNLTQIKDKFKDDKLASLSYIDGNNRISYYDELNFDYNLTNIGNALQFGTLNPYVAFPLIGSNRRYECATGSGSDITTVSGTIDTRELFPAIPVWKIFQYIEQCYGFTFSGVFLESIAFKKLWLYCKNAESFTSYPQPLKINWTSSAIPVNTVKGYLDLVTDELIFKFNDLPATNANANIRLESWINIIPTDPSIQYSIEVYDNNILYRTYENRFGTTDQCYFSRYRWDETKVNGEYPLHKFSFKISSVVPMTFTSQIQYKRNAGYGVPPFSNHFGGALSQSTSGFLNIQKYVPDITVESFLIGIIKMHNLMIIPINENTFEFITMDAYFERGSNIDITKYCSTETEEISKPTLFKAIKFLFEKSENIINNAFRGLFNRDYGDLDYTNENITSTEVYEVKLPFEDIMYERYIPPITTGNAVTNFVTATLWNKDRNPYTPKAVLMYDNGFIPLLIDGVSDDIKYKFGLNNFTSEQYRRFTNEIEIGATDQTFLYSLNFSDELGVVNTENAPPKGLYDTYYSNYVENLYNIKTRKVTVKAILNTLMVNNIKLYDRIIYKNKRYTINTMTVDLVTKETTFELLSDFRQLITNQTPLRSSNIQAAVLDNTAQNLELQIFLNDKDLWRSKVAVGFLNGTYPITANQYKDGLLNISVPANVTGIARTDNVLIEYFKGLDSEVIEIKISQDA
jgi:hypothetical protein